MNLIDLFNVNVKEGKIIELGHELYAEIPHHPAHSPFVYSMSRMHGDTTYDDGVCTANDLITTGSHTGTHIDAIGHVSCNGVLNGSIPVDGNQSKTTGLSVHGVENIQPIFSRGILLDVANYKGVDCLQAGYSISKEDIIQTMHFQNTTINTGDVVLIRTGWTKYFDNPAEYLNHGNSVPGVSLEAAQYLVSLGMNITGSDTSAYEVGIKNQFPVHKLLLVEKGINIIELMNLEALSLEKKYEFIFVCLPLRIKGATASPIRPIAIV